VEPQAYAHLRQEIVERIVTDRALLDRLRSEIRPLKSQVRRIQTRTTTSISLVATDGGNNSVQFDPSLVQIVRIVDSSNNEYCLEAITPTTSVSNLSAKQFHADSSPCTALGEMMWYLGVSRLQDVSPYIRSNEKGLVKSNFGTDTLIIYDGLLRSTIFSGDLFQKYLQGISDSIELQQQKNHRQIYLAGVAKHSKVLSRYRLAMALESILTTSYPAYLAIPPEIEQKAYLWSAYALGDDQAIAQRNVNTFAGGKMHFVKFGSGRHDPIWSVDIFLPQIDKTAHILGCMLADALNGFPVPLYPQSLQKAHANATLADFDFDVLQNYIFDGIRQVLASEASTLDIFRLREADPSLRRYE